MAVTRLVEVEDLSPSSSGETWTYAWDAAGRLTQLALPTGVVATYSHEPDTDHLDLVTWTATAPDPDVVLAVFDYETNAAGVPESMDEQVVDPATGLPRYRRTVWEHDDLDRLTSELITELDAPGGTALSNRLAEWQYDAVGNRTRQILKTGVPVPTTVVENVDLSHDANDRLQWRGGDSFTWDAEGRLTSVQDASGTTTYTWDDADRLVGLEPPTGPELAFGYDPDGLLTSRAEGSSGPVETYLYDTLAPHALRVETRDGGGVLQARHVHGVRPLRDVPVEPPGAPADYVHASLGTTRALLSGSAVTQAPQWTAWGEALEAGAAPTFGYTGEPGEADAGLVYLRARWMVPAMGAFASRDSFEGVSDIPLSMAAYLYAHSTPQRETDPSGLFVSTVELAAVQAIRATLSTLQETLGDAFIAAVDHAPLPIDPQPSNLFPQPTPGLGPIGHVRSGFSFLRPLRHGGRLVARGSRSRITTRVYATVTSHGRVLYQGPVDLGPTVRRISRGVRQHGNDFTTFHNRGEAGLGGGRLLPYRTDPKYYTEFTHRTPQARAIGKGPERIIVGRDGDWWYSADHYGFSGQAAIPLNQAAWLAKLMSGI